MYARVGNAPYFDSPIIVRTGILVTLANVRGSK